MSCNTIRVYLDKFVEWFGDFGGQVTEKKLESAYFGAQSFISTKLGTIVLPPELQERGVYCATAHALYLLLNPSVVANGKITSASEGSVSAGFATPPFKNWFEYNLSLTSYGMELLAILEQAQPPVPDKPYNTLPYYGAGFGRRW